MTVLIGYINSNYEESIGSVFSDNKETTSEGSKLADKLTEINNRFVIGFSGLAITSVIVELWIKNLEQFVNSFNQIETISDLIKELENGINKCIPYMKSNDMIDQEYYDSYKDLGSDLFVLDHVANKLYYLELGQVFMNTCSIKCNELDPGNLYKLYNCINSITK
jgi:hypothetical protein